MSRGLNRCYNIARLRERASRRLPAPMFHYIDGAAGDEWTMRQNTDAFDRYELVPRFLVDVSEVDLTTTVFWPRDQYAVFLFSHGNGATFSPPWGDGSGAGGKSCRNHVFIVINFYRKH